MNEDVHESNYPPVTPVTPKQLISELETSITLLEYALVFARGGKTKLAEQNVSAVRNRLRLICSQWTPPW